MAKKVIITIHLPLGLEKGSELLMAINDIFPGATSRPGEKNKLEILAEVE